MEEWYTLEIENWNETKYGNSLVGRFGSYNPSNFCYKRCKDLSFWFPVVGKYICEGSSRLHEIVDATKLSRSHTYFSFIFICFYINNVNWVTLSNMLCEQAYGKCGIGFVVSGQKDIGNAST